MIDRNLALEMTRVTEAAALASAGWMGKGDAPSADMSATSAMRNVLNSISFNGTVIIGKGEQSESSALYVGETVGASDEPSVEIVCDPLESTQSVAFGRPNALAVIAIAPHGSFMPLPDLYMEKIATGPDAADVIDLNLSLEDNVRRVARAKQYKVQDLTVVLLDRDRHQNIISRLRNLGTRIHLIPDGDVSGAIATAMPGTGVDLLVGIGGAQQGVLAAAALRCLGGAIQTKFVLNSETEKEKIAQLGINDIRTVYTTDNLAKGENIMFAATGITDGDLLNGVRYRSDGATTNSLVMRSASRTRRYIVTEHFFDGQPKY